MHDRHLERKEARKEYDPLLDKPERELFFQHEEREAEKTSAEKARDKVVEAGNDTRNTNQYVKLVNAHIQNKVSTLQRIKEAQKKFEQEVDMFKVNSAIEEQPHARPTQSGDVESMLIIKELSVMINKYGIEKISKALDQILKP
jgi:hypothetical protein